MNTVNEHISIAKKLYDSIGRIDIDSLHPLLDDNVHALFPFSPFAEGKAGYVGKETVIAALKKSVPRLVEQITFFYDNFYPGQDKDILTMQFHSTGIRTRGNGIYENEYVAILRFVDNKIIYWAEYFDVIRGAGGVDKLCGKTTPKLA